MNILFCCQGDDGSLLAALRKRLDAHTIYEWSASSTIPRHEITAAIAWMPPDDFFDDLPNLKQVFAVAAGVDHFLKHPGLPKHVPVVRLTDAGMGQQMAEYVLYGALHAQRRMHDYKVSQATQHWAHDLAVRPASETRVGILGAGQLGATVAERLTLNHYSVSCWSRSAKILPAGVISIHGTNKLSEFVSRSDVLVCLLPLTESTAGILNGDLFSHLPRGAYLINPGRGGHLVDDDLLEALDSGQLSGAMLDVFHKEPLPAEHPLWSHPRVLVTPHVAAKSLVNESADQIVNSIDCMNRGVNPPGLVDRNRGY